MAVPRVALLAIVGVVLIAGAFAATQLTKKQGESGSSSDAPSNAQPAESSAKGKAKEETAAVTPKRKEATAREPAGVPPRVGRALANKEIVVLFLSQGAADDDATAEAARSVRGLSGVTVASDSIDNVSEYRSVVAGLDITQAPAIVVVDGEGRGRLVEGYTDPATLRQLVEDAR